MIQFLLVLLALLQPAYAQSCTPQLGDCELDPDQPFDYPMTAYTYFLGNEIYFTMFWGLVVGLLYWKSRNAELTGVIGIFIVSLGIYYGTLTNLTMNWIYVGVTLLFASVGLSILGVIRRAQGATA